MSSININIEEYKTVLTPNNDLVNMNDHYIKKILDLEKQLEDKQNMIDSFQTNKELFQSYRISKTDVEKVLEGELHDLTEKQKYDALSLKQITEEKQKLETLLYKTNFELNKILKSDNQTVVRDTNLTQSEYLIELIEKLKIKVETLRLENENLKQKIDSFNTNEIIVNSMNKTNDNLNTKIKELESECSLLKNQILSLCKELEKNKKDLDESKNQVFSLMHKLSYARSEILSAEEIHKKEIHNITVNFEAQKVNMFGQLNLYNEQNNKLLMDLKYFNNDLLKNKEDLLTKDKEIEQLINENNEIKQNLNLCQISKEISNKEIKEKEVGLCNKGMNEDLNQENISLKSQVSKLDECLKKQDRDCNRLRKHLLNLEQGYTEELLESQKKYENLLKDFEALKKQIEDFKLAEENKKSEIRKQEENLKSQIVEISEDRERFKLELKNSEKLIAEYSQSIKNLNEVLEQFQKNQISLQSVELEKCRKILIKETFEKNKLKEDLITNEKQISELNKQLQKKSSLKAILDNQLHEISLLKNIVSEYEKRVAKSEEQRIQYNSENEAKIDKILIKSLLIGYFHTHESKKQDALLIIGKFLDFSQDDFISISMGTQWVKHLMLMNSSSNDENNLYGTQSFSELLIKFLEKESLPMFDIKVTKSQTNTQSFEIRNNLFFGLTSTNTVQKNHDVPLMTINKNITNIDNNIITSKDVKNDIINQDLIQYTNNETNTIKLIHLSHFINPISKNHNDNYLYLNSNDKSINQNIDISHCSINKICNDTEISHILSQNHEPNFDNPNEIKKDNVQIQDKLPGMYFQKINNFEKSFNLNFPNLIAKNSPLNSNSIKLNENACLHNNTDIKSPQIHSFIESLKVQTSNNKRLND